MGIKKKNLLWALLFPLLYMVILWNLTPFVYGIVDDRTMMEVVSGQYLGTPDPHTIFIGYWYSCLVAGLYRLIPNVDWYALGFLTLQGICLGMMVWRLLKEKERPKARIYTLSLLFLLSVILGIRTAAQVTFTTTAAVLGVTVLFWYLTAECFRAKELIILFLLCFLTAEARFPVYCMILPVCGVLWVFRFWKDFREKEQDRGHLLVPLVAAGALILHLLGFFVGYKSEGWKAYNDYNDVCTVIFDYEDYTFPRYEDATELYNQVGIYEKVRAKNLYYYNYTADDQIDMEFFKNYLDHRMEMVKATRNPALRLWGSFKTYVKNVLTGGYGYGHLLALAGLGLLVLWYGVKKEWFLVLRACGVYGAQFALWMYLVYRGRVPLRVEICMNLMLMMSVLLLWKEHLHKEQLLEKLQKGAACLVLVFLFASACWSVGTVRQENLNMQKENQKVEALKEYCAARPENFYFNDVVSMAMSSYNIHLWLDRPYEMNYISLGDWISFCPAWEEKLQKRGITNVAKALYEEDQIYLICSFERGLEYLSGLYEGVTCTEVDKVGGFRIYQIRR